MSKESKLYEREDMNLRSKYLKLMDLLVTNKSVTKIECIIFFSIFYIQILSGFFSPDIGILNSVTSNSDTILYYINMILRIKNLFKDSYSGFQAILVIILLALILLAIFTYHITKTMTKNSVYAFKETILNFSIKGFVYVLFIPILDLCLANICFEDQNPNFKDLKCSGGNGFIIFIGIILFIYNIFLGFFIHLFYSDSLLLSNSYYAKMSYPYEIYLTANNIFYSILLSQTRTMGNELFLFYNLIISFILLKVYFERYVFYNSSINTLVGAYHALYAWTSAFFIIFNYFPIQDIGIVYIIGIIILIILFLNIKKKIDEKILLEIPFHKILNNYYLLFYLKSILERINNIDSNSGERAKLIGIIELHAVECPNPECPTKNKSEKLYLPAVNEWSNRDKPEVNDKVYLFNLPIFIFNIFFGEENCSPDILLNMSHYYISMIKNVCQSMIVFKRIKEMKLSVFDKFTLIRLENIISQNFSERLKPSTEICTQIEELNCSLYFKYQDLSHNFFDEINNDILLTLEFWKTFKAFSETNKLLDFNKIFTLVDKIRISKIKIEKIWEELYSTNSNVNDIFELYYNYIEQINDDDLLKRDLEQIKNKTSGSSEQINLNYYSHLFSRNTAMIIANGDKGKEGYIEHTSEDIDKVFLFKPEELKGLNVIGVMPKMFQGPHQSLMRRYVTVGEKRLVDKNFKAFAKDKENMLIHVGLVLRQFPLLTDNILYCALIIKGPIEDAMYLDRQFNIQGMCRKLQQRFEIDSKIIFSFTDFPFYIMCKDFIEFYSNYILPKKSNVNSNIARIMDLDAKSEAQLIEDNLDNYNEATELEFTAKIPQFFMNYVNIVNKRDIKLEFKLKNDEEEESQENSGNEYEEDDALVKDNQDQTDKPDKLNLNKVNDEDRDYLSKVHHMRTLFNSKKFDELMETIDKLNDESPTKEHNFIFNMIVHKYGRGEKGFIIRCIDNKGENEDDESDSVGSKDGKLSGRVKVCKEAKVESIVDIHQITHEEKESIAKSHSDYNSLNSTNREFVKLSNYFKKEITEYSKIFGAKKEDTNIEEDGASQGSSAGFNDNLSKKQRIEEIRSNIMNNVSGFYALKWIKIIFLLMLFVTAGFSGFYLIIYTTMYHTINNLSELNINYFQTTIWLSNIVSSIISMRSVFDSYYKNEDLNFNTFIPNIDIYFEELRTDSSKWYTSILNRFGPIEQKMSIYYNTNPMPLWKTQKITYPSNRKITDDLDTFPLGISQSLSAVNKLMKSETFSPMKIKQKEFTEEEVNRLHYSAYISIENTINNIIPSQILMLNKITTDFSTFNSENIFYVVVIIIAYGLFMIILSILYLIFLYITNKNMQEGFEKASMMKIDKIDETIKKIEGFNEKHLSKFRIKETRSTENIKINNDVTPVNDKNSQGHDKTKNFSNESKKIKNLNVVTFSYLQVLFLIVIILSILIPLYSISLNMISESNQILSIQTYIFGRLVYASHKTVNIKCLIAECQIEKPIDYGTGNNFITSSQIENIVRDIITFDSLSDFYNNKFLLNACNVIYNTTDSKYNECMNDIIIKSANNTDSLLKLLDETVSTIEKDHKIKTNKLIISNGKSIMFKNKYLYETEYFHQLENVFYKYITPISDEFEKIVNSSLQSYLNEKKFIIIIIVVVFTIVIMIFAIYVIFVFNLKLIHLLSVSRCILKIIPTNVIINTSELETWLESKY